MNVAVSLRDVVERERRRAGVPGCAVLVVSNGTVVLNEGFGLRDQSGLPVTSKTLFPIGSATKTFTAALLATLADEKGVDLDAPIRRYLPSVALQDPGANERLSIRDCLSHRSGLPRHDVLWQAGEGSLTRRDILAALAHLPASQPFRTTYQYNNLLYIAAGELVGILAGIDFEQACAERLLLPLGMTRTNFSVAATQEDSDHATPYLGPAGAAAPREIPFASLGLASPAGGINTCTDDLIPWLLTLTGRGSHGCGPPLPATTLDQLRTPAIAMPASDGSEVIPVSYGLGLMLGTYRGAQVSHHGGNIDGFSSQILTREDGVGIAVLCNLHATWLRDALPYLILDLLDGVESPDHGTFFRDRLAAKLAQAQAARSVPGLADTLESSELPFSDYPGRYCHPGYGEITIELRHESLTWTYRTLPAGELRRHTRGFFEATSRLNGDDISWPARFSRGHDGAVDGFLLQLEAEVPPIRFQRCTATTAVQSDDDGCLRGAACGGVRTT